MKFLIIDDDDFKVGAFTKHLTSKDTFTIRKSYCTGLRELVTNKENYDCLILDMNFPHFDNDRVQSDEGLKVLQEIKRKQINIAVVIYSSKYVDVSEYSNVKDYISFGTCDIKNIIDSIKNTLI